MAQRGQTRKTLRQTGRKIDLPSAKNAASKRNLQKSSENLFAELCNGIPVEVGTVLYTPRLFVTRKDGIITLNFERIALHVTLNGMWIHETE